MKFLFLDLSEGEGTTSAFAGELVRECDKRDHRGVDAKCTVRPLSSSAHSFGKEPVLGLYPENSSENERILNHVNADALIILAGCETKPVRLADLGLPQQQFLSGFFLRVKPNQTFELEDLFSNKRWLIPEINATAVERIVDIALDSVVHAAGLEMESFDLSSPEADAIIETARQLRRLGLAAPKGTPRPEMMENISVAGELESVREEDVIIDPSLWIKGWIAWDEKRFRRLEVVLDDRVFDLTLLDLRADVLARDNAISPTGFEVEIDLDGLPCGFRLEIWIIDRDGLRWRWMTRQLWRNNSIPARQRTPLITGTAKLVRDKVISQPQCQNRRITAIAAYQAGECIGACTAELDRDPDEPLTFWLARSNVSSKMIHLHVFFEDGGRVAWICLDPETGSPIHQATFGEQDDGQVVSEGFARPVWAPDGDQSEIRWTLNGLPSVVEGHSAEIDISGEPGRIVLEAETGQRNYRSWNFWRHCRDALEGPRLPAFVVPCASPKIVKRTKRPNVLLLRPAAAPTDELYVLAPLQKLKDAGRIKLRVVETSDDRFDEAERKHLLESCDSVIVSRYLPDGWIASLSSRRSELSDVFYVMDDNVTLAEDDPGMRPPNYRKRMVGVAHGEFQTMLHLCSRLIVTSEVLKNLYASDKTDLLTPPYLAPCAGLDHLSDFSEIRIEYHGTQVHRNDLAFIAPALVAIRDTYEHVKINVWMGRSTPDLLRAQNRIEIKKDIPWEDYKRYVSESRAHIALAPLLHTPYNCGKSFVKVLDNARLGAVGLYSRRDPYFDVISHGKDGFLLENDHRVWERTLRWLIDNPQEIARTASAAQDLAKQLGDISKLVAYWSKHLLSGDAAAELLHE